MTKLIIVPPLDPNVREVEQITARVGVPFVVPAALFDLFEYLYQGHGYVVASLTADQLALVVREAGQLLSEMPIVVHDAPGASYDPQWNIAAQRLIPEPYSSVEKMFQKSGQANNNLADLQKAADKSNDALRPHTNSAIRRMGRSVYRELDAADEDVDMPEGDAI